MPNAIPTLFQVPNPPPMATPQRHLKLRKVDETLSKLPAKSDYSSLESSIQDTPQKRMLKRKVQALKIKLWRKDQRKQMTEKKKVESLIHQLKGFLPYETVCFIEQQIFLHKSGKAQRRYAITDKMLALSIF